MDRSAPPRQISSGGENAPRFGPAGQVLFRFTDNKANYVGRMNRDRIGPLQNGPVSDRHIQGVSPDRRWLIAHHTAVGSGKNGGIHGSADWRRISTTDLREREGVPERLVSGWKVLVCVHRSEVTHEHPAGRSRFLLHRKRAYPICLKQASSPWKKRSRFREARSWNSRALFPDSIRPPTRTSRRRRSGTSFESLMP